MILVLSLMISSFSFGAAAEDLDTTSNWINVLDYNMTTNCTFQFTSSSTRTFDLPGRTRLWKIDILVFCAKGDTLSLAVSHGNSTFPLTRVAVSGSIYRFYGDIYDTNYEDLTLVMTGGGAASYTGQYYSIMVTNNNINPVDTLGGYMGSTYSKYIYNYMTSKNTSITDSVYYPAASDFNLDVYTSSWRSFDYVDFLVYVRCESINSIYATFEGQRINVEYDYIEDGSPSLIFLSLRMDLRGLDRTSSEYPFITIVGSCVADTYLQFTLSSVVGSVIVEEPNVTTYWFEVLFDKLSTWFNNLISSVKTGFNNVKSWLSSGFKSVVDKLDVLVNGSKEQQAAADQYKEQSKEQADKIDAAVDQMEVAKPNASDLDVSVGGITGGLDFSLFNTALLTVTSGGTVYRLLFLSVTLMLVSYVLFGKKV